MRKTPNKSLRFSQRPSTHICSTVPLLTPFPAAVPVVLIEGLQERHIQRGSILGITCVVRHAPQEAPENILWFHGALSIDYDSPRGGVSIQCFIALSLHAIIFCNYCKST
ncbi:hypothetical protein E2C01_086836 [Portunus trituberculatus]|uniref:Ig-like domain-containing protein n=1 Tax=Portunus trituberculatus TaxID=210409 RepID=A0A5B7JFQ2_PORTR|nr:hypothetical protein [Portunus trituberculatus]